MPKVSIIIAAYNAERYIHKCLNSILQQTYSDFEVIIVNDGSVDSTGVICDKYSTNDNRIKVYHKENGGVSSARQFGVEVASGDYLIHADPDDWMDSNCLEEMYQCAVEQSVDVVICDYYMDYEISKKSVHIGQKPSGMGHIQILEDFLTSKLHGSCWNKLVKRDCIEKYGIRFPLEISYTEDLYFNLALFKNNISTSYLNKAFYHYVQDVNCNSIVKHYSKAEYQKDMIKIGIYDELFKEHEFLSLCHQLVIYHLVVRAYIGHIFSNFEFKKLFYEYRQDILGNRTLPLYMKYSLYLSCVGFYDLSYFIKKTANLVLKSKN